MQVAFQPKFRVTQKSYYKQQRRVFLDLKLKNLLPKITSTTVAVQRKIKKRVLNVTSVHSRPEKRKDQYEFFIVKKKQNIGRFVENTSFTQNLINRYSKKKLQKPKNFTIKQLARTINCIVTQSILAIPFLSYFSTTTIVSLVYLELNLRK